MKKVLAVLSLSLMLAGCSQLDAFMEKIPFLSKADHNGSSVETEDEAAKQNEAGQDNENDSVPDEAEQPPELSLEAAFFNEIEVINGVNYIQNPLNVMALVNKQFSLTDDYTPSDLVRPAVAFSFGDQDIEKSYMRKEAAGALEQMFAAAEIEGVELFAVSGYRSYDRQSEVFGAQVAQVGEEEAVKTVAVPGSSEHQTGLAMDISSRSVNLELTEKYEETLEGQWLANNAHRFGFILRYPKGKEAVTGYNFEPWHYRYVGTEAAKIIFEKNITLEEYFNIVEKI